MAEHVVNLKQSEIRQAITLRVKFPRLLGLRLRASVLLFRLAATVAGVGIEIETEGG